MSVVEKKTVQIPKELSLGEQIEEALPSTDRQSGVVLVPDGDRSMHVFYRGTGGAWWRTSSFNERGESVRLETELRDRDKALLITRDQLDGLLDGTICLHQTDDH